MAPGNDGMIRELFESFDSVSKFAALGRGRHKNRVSGVALSQCILVRRSCGRAPSELGQSLQRRLETALAS